MSEQLASPAVAPQGLPPGMEGLPAVPDMAMAQALPEHGVNLPEYGVDLPEHGVNLPEYGVAEVPGAGMSGETTGINPISPVYEQMASQCETPGQLRNAVYEGMYSELQDRVATDPTPTEQEMQMGTYKEGIEPQARDAVMAMRAKGYNTLSSGFENQEGGQGINFDIPLSDGTVGLLRQHGFELGTALFRDTDNPARGTWRDVSAAHITFKPENPMDLSAMKSKWDELASILPDLGQQAPPAMHGFAENFRQAARTNTLQDYVKSWDYKPTELVSKEPGLTDPGLEQTAIPTATSQAEQQVFSQLETETEASQPKGITERIKARVEKEVEGLVTKIGEKAVDAMLAAEFPEASIAMKLASLEGPTEQQQGGRIDDPAKAEAMASASKAQEEEVVRANNAAEEASQHIGIQDNWRSRQYRSAESEYIAQNIRADRARQAADQLAQAAAETYDKLKSQGN